MRAGTSIASPARLGAALLGLLGIAVAASLLLGSGGLDAELIRTLRAPRVAAAAGVGALLALAGLAMQVVLRNPLADPYVLGTSGGASVGALLALAAGGSLWLGAGAGALLAALALLALTRSALASTDDASSRLVLTGAMLAALLGATATLLLTVTPDLQLRGALFWLVGDLGGVVEPWPAPAGAALFALWLAWRGQGIDRLMLGSEAAALLGEPVRRLRLQLLVAGALATGIAVALAGAIGFVGLVAPQALRLLGVERTRELAWMAPVAGAAVLVLADLAARTLVAPLELPVGAVMALLGAPLFIHLLARGTR